MYFPQIDNERDGYYNYLKAQIEAVAATAYGLTDEQAWARPFRSEMTIAGLISHVGYCMNGALAGYGAEPDPRFETQNQPASFHPDPAMGIDALLAAFDELKGRYLDMIAELDMDAVMPAGPMPWFGLDEPVDAAMRYLVVHHIEEFARHAGHGDLIREEIDGAKAAELNAAIEGRPANAFVTPWSPG